MAELRWRNVLFKVLGKSPDNRYQVLDFCKVWNMSQKDEVQGESHNLCRVREVLRWLSALHHHMPASSDPVLDAYGYMLAWRAHCTSLLGRSPGQDDLVFPSIRLQIGGHGVRHMPILPTFIS